MQGISEEVSWILITGITGIEAITGEEANMQVHIINFIIQN